jgi:hypothetical protein
MDLPEPIRPTSGPEAPLAAPLPPSSLPFGHEFYVVPARPTLQPGATSAPAEIFPATAPVEPVSLTPETSQEPPAAPVPATEKLPPVAPEVPDPYSQPTLPLRQGHQREDPRRAHLKQYLQQREQSGSPEILQPPGGPETPSTPAQRAEIFRPHQQPPPQRPQHPHGQRPYGGQPQPQAPRVPQKPASPQSVEQAVRHTERIIDSLKRSLDMMEEVLDSLEIARLRGEAEEREIQELTRALQRLQRMEERIDYNRPRPAADAPGATTEEPPPGEENGTAENEGDERNPAA